MDIRKIILIILWTLWTFSIHANNAGIAFIHGTNDHRIDARGVYWKNDYIESLISGLINPENVFVVHCNFSFYMWHEDAGDCAAEQLMTFIKEKNIDSLTVFTHSNGGNVIRWILSNPTYNSNFSQLHKFISKVIALTPSSGGTAIADLVLNGGSFGSKLSWLLGYNGDAVRQQRLGDMKIYNNELLYGTQGRPSLPVAFNVIVGTDVTASPFSTASYCNGYLLNSGLKISKLYLDKCADGFLSCDSQKAAGKVWFYDKEQTTNQLTLSHNQSRHSCFGMDKILLSTFAAVDGDFK